MLNLESGENALFKIAKKESAKQIVEEIQMGKMNFDRTQAEDDGGDTGADRGGGGTTASDAANMQLEPWLLTQGGNTLGCPPTSCEMCMDLI